VTLSIPRRGGELDDDDDDDDGVASSRLGHK